MANRNIPLRGPGYEPTGPAWDRATPAARRTYWRRLGDYALGVKRDEVRRGIGADGKPLDPVKPSSRPDGATGKPLDPHYGASRTVRLLAVAVGITGATLFWRGHGRRSWTEILGYHADGLVRGAPVRDTIGISPAGVRKVQAEGKELWKRQTRGAVKPPVSPPPVTPPPPPAKGVYPARVRPKAGSRTILVYEEDEGTKPPTKVRRASFPTDAEKREQARLAREKAERERAEAERARKKAEAEARVKAEKARLERERLAREKAEKERLERERLAREKAEREEKARREALAKAQAQAQTFAGPVLPGQPIGERIAAYTEGDRKVKAVLDAGARLAAVEKEISAGSAAAHDTFQKLQAEKFKIDYRLRWGKPKPGDEARSRELGDAMQAATRDLVAASNKFLAAKQEARDAINATLATAAPVKLSRTTATKDSDWNPLDPLDAATLAESDKGLRWLERVTRRGDADALATGFGQARPGQEDRAHYSDTYNYVKLKPGEKADVTVHELGHMLEYRLTTAGGKAGDAVKAFLAHRVGNETPRKMQDVAPGSNYGDNEYGRKDHFDRVFDENGAYYTGKIYSDGATEVLSMGLQLLYNDPVKFARNDPEYFKLVVGLLDGSLR